MRKCDLVQQNYAKTIEDIVSIQRSEFKESIFFIYEDGSTSDIYKGTETSISLGKVEQRRILNNGNLVSSVHTHPSGFDLSTIDIMTGVLTQQDHMCVATPVKGSEGSESYVLTCLDFDGLDALGKQRLFRAMRRSSVGATNLGRLLRKEFSMKRIGVSGCRSVNIE